MNEGPLPAELAELERRLSDLHNEEPSPALRARVMGEAIAELRRSQRQKTWNLVAAMAVAVLVWVNLSLSAATATPLRSDRAAERALRETVESQIRALLPEASDREVTRQALLLSCGSRLAACPYSETGTASLAALGRVEDLLP